MRIVIVGAGGRLGGALQREYAREHEVIGFNHAQLDIGDPDQIHRSLGATDFELLINCAAQTNVDRCETHREEAFQLNAEAPRVLASVCNEKRAKLIHISTDYVFDGAKPEPYTEEDPALPISGYGESKLRGEQLVLEAGEQHLVVRVSWVFGPDRPSFIDAVLKKAREEEEVAAIADKFAAPTYTHDVAEMLTPLFSDASGIVHLVNGGACSWQEYAQWALDCCRAEGIPMKARTVGKLSLTDMKNFIARRPVNTVLSTEKYERMTGNRPRHWCNAVAEYVRDYVSTRN
jgi:dTDP-4-dehydrorhamnose reductase